MSQKQKSTRPKRKIEAHLHSAIIVNQPMVRDFSTGGGHLPEGWDQPGDVLQLEETVRGHAAAGDAEAEAAGR